MDSIVTSIDDYSSDIKYFKSINRMNNTISGLSFSTKDYSNKNLGNIYDEKFKAKFSMKTTDLRSNPEDYQYGSAIMFPPEYFNSVNKAGAVSSISDFDGYTRVAIDIIKYKDAFYPSIALKTFSFLNDNENYLITDKEIIGEKSKVHIPLLKDNSGMYSLLRYYKPISPHSSYTHKIYSAIDIMDSYNELKSGRKPLVSPTEFDGKIVFIGANVKAAATGLSDVKQTPISSDHSGLDIQATTLDNIMHNYFMRYFPNWLNIAITLTLIVITFVIINRFNLFYAVTGVVILIVCYILLSAFSFSKGYSLNVLTPITMTIITMIFAYSYKYIVEDKNKEKIKSAMGKYISEDIMQNVVKNIDELKLGGKKANVTVLFADIRGFTSMSEKLSADEVSVILNEYFTEIEPIVTRYNGVINKFIGDAVMAIFGAPIEDNNHPKNAVRCACDMLAKVDELQEKWLNEGKPKIEIGIGINTGEAFVGNIGSEKRMEYTVIGDMVNLASRIESNNKIYKTNLLISSSTFDYVRGIVDTIKISNVKIRGKEKTLDLYEVIRLIG
jgi:adenylate cyclase